MIFQPQGTERARFDTSGNFIIKTLMRPDENGTRNFGSSSYKWATIYANTFSGNATTASAWETARTLKLVGNASGEVSIDGSQHVDLNVTINGLVTDAAQTFSGLKTFADGIYVGGRNSSIAGQVQVLGKAGAIYLQTDNTATGNRYLMSYNNNGDYCTPILIDSNNNVTFAGNASTATKLATARTFSLTGSVTGSASFDGSGNVSITTTTNHTHSYAGSDSAGGAANYIKTTAASDNAARHVFFAYNGDTVGSRRVVYDDNFKYNPSTNVLSVDSITGSAAKLTTPRNITIGDTVKAFDGSSAVSWTLDEIGASTAINGSYYGTCTTAADTAAKTVTLVDSTNFALKAGAIIAVKFTNANNANNPTLNVNSTGAKPIYRYGTTAVSTGTTTTGWRAGAVQFFVYDGTGWVRDFWENSTYYYTSVYCTTGASTAAKVGSGSYYALNKGYLQVMMANANSVAGAITFNIASKGAKPIYINGVASSASNYTLPAGIYIVYYDGSAYHFRTDGLLPGYLDSVTSSNTESKIYLMGATSQTTTPKTYSNSKVYAQGGFLYSNNLKVATESYVTSAINNLVNAAPGALDTLDELAAALGDDANFATTVTNLIGTKQATITGAATTITSSNLTANRALISNGNGKVAVSAITSTELGYLDGVTSAIQTQLNAKTPYATCSKATAATAGWYRIATTSSGISNCNGLFQIVGAVSGKHTTATIMAGTSYGVNASSNISVLQCAQYSGNALTKVRIVYHTSYSGNYAYLEVYNPSDKAITITVKMIGGNGWALVDPDTAGSIPSGYSNKEVTLVNGTIYSEKFSGDGASLTGLSAANISAGTLPVARGGTGKATLTSGEALIGAGTGAVTTRGINNMTTKSYIAHDTKLMTTNTLAYWNGAYASGGQSNLTYCNQGAFGNVVTKSYTDSSSASAIGTGTSIPTERDIYYGLPTINNSHSYTSSTTIYAPSTGGTAGQVLMSAGSTSTPTWGMTLYSYTTAAMALSLNTWTNVATAANLGNPATGTYIIQVTAGGVIYSGVMSWDATATTASVYDEILLHSASTSTAHVTARVNRTGGLKLQLCALDAAVASGTITIKMRQVI